MEPKQAIILAVVLSLALSSIVSLIISAGLSSSAEKRIEEKTRKALAEIDAKKENIEDTIGAIERARSQALDQIRAAKNDALQSIDRAERDALQAIEGATEKALRSIEERRAEALDAVRGAEKAAVRSVQGEAEKARSVIDAAREDALKRIGSARDAALEAIRGAEEEALKAIMAARNQSIADLKAAYTAIIEAVESGNATTLLKTVTEEPTRLHNYSIDILFYFRPHFCCREDTNATVHVVVYINNLPVLNKTLHYPSILYDKYPPLKAHVELTAPYIASVRAVATGMIEGKLTGASKDEANPYSADITRLTVSITYHYYASSLDHMDIDIERAG